MHTTKTALAAAILAGLTLAAPSVTVNKRASPDCSRYTNATSTYPSQAQICAIQSQFIGSTLDVDLFLSNLADDFTWTVHGTWPLAGVYTDKALIGPAIFRLNNLAPKSQPFDISLLNIIGGGEDEWSTQILPMRGVALSGLVIDDVFVSNTRWNTEGKIVEVNMFYDTALWNRAFVESEIGEFTYTDVRTANVPYEVLTPSNLTNSTAFERVNLTSSA